MGEGSDALMRDEDERMRGSNDAVGTSGDDPAATPETAEIRANIEQTRADMSETIEAIQGRLSPHNLKEQVKSSVREATIGKAEDMVRSASYGVSEVRSTMMETIRHNPVPAAMVGLGLGWLFMNRRSAPRYDQRRYRDEGYGLYDARDYGAEGAYRGYGVDASYRGNDRPEGAYEGRHEGSALQGQRPGRSTVNKVQNTVGNVAERAQDAVGDAAGRAQETVGNVVNQAQETASDFAARTQRQAMRLEDRFESALRENPLAVGAIALAVGAAFGLVAPATERENELLGEARDTLVERAQEVAQNTAERIQQVAGQVVDDAQHTAKQAAHEQGLTS